MSKEIPIKKGIRYRFKIHPDTDAVLKSIPNPFGSFEKATYVLYKHKSIRIILYSFTTTCRNTEDCINIMKEVFKSRNEYNPYSNLCKIYKIRKSIKTLIFSDLI